MSSNPLRRQLAVIRGGEQDGFFELRLRREGASMRQAFIEVSRPDRVEELVGLNSKQGDIYLAVAPRVRRSGKAEDVERIWCCWCDADTLESWLFVEEFEIQPTMVVCSGSGMHCYWSLMEPAAPGDVVAMNRRLAAALKADHKSCDAARVLRPHGSLNHKWTPPRKVGIVRRTDTPTALADLDRALPPLPDAPAPLRPPAERVDDTEDLLKGIPAEEYVPRLTGREINREGFVQCPFHANGEERTPSLKVYANTWTCYACDPVPGAGRQHLGGGIYQLAALMFGYDLPLRGSDFSNVQRELEHMFIDEELRIT